MGAYLLELVSKCYEILDFSRSRLYLLRKILYDRVVCNPASVASLFFHYYHTVLFNQIPIVGNGYQLRRPEETGWIQPIPNGQFFLGFYQISTDSIWYLIERFCSWTTLTMWTDPRGSIFESFSTDKDWASMTSCNLFKFSLSLIYLRLAGLRSWCIYFTCIKTMI